MASLQIEADHILSILKEHAPTAGTKAVGPQAGEARAGRLPEQASPGRFQGENRLFALRFGRAKAPRLGDLWSEAVRHYYEKERLAKLVPTKSWYPASIFFQGMKYMLFGDPSLRLPGPAKVR